MTKLQFQGGGTQPTAPRFHRSRDSYFSKANLELVMGIGEGPIKGLNDGLRSFYLGNTPLLNEDETLNFPSVDLIINKGTDEGEEITPQLGGFASSEDVSVSLSQNEPITRTGVQKGLTAIDWRFTIAGLSRTTDTGIYSTSVQLKIEVKPKNSTEWQPANFQSVSDPQGFKEIPDYIFDESATDYDRYYQYDSQSYERYLGYSSLLNGNKISVALISDDTPLPPQNIKSVWLKPSENYKPYIWSGELSEWVSEATWVENTSTTDTLQGQWETVYFDIGVGPLSHERDGDLNDYILNTTDGLLYRSNGKNWVEVTSSIQYVGHGLINIHEKVSSTSVVEFRTFFEQPTEEVFDLRVTKISEDTVSDGTLTSAIGWESFQEITHRQMKFPNTATYHLLGQASDQLTSISSFFGVWDGRIVKVPTNYDPETREYEGIWDGTWKLAFSNNPAFVFKDFVENTLYGLSAVFPHHVNPWSIYDWARWCDEEVPDGRGGTRPRWTYNDVVSEPRSRREMAQYIAGAAAALYVDDGNGAIEILIDRDRDPVKLFTSENVIAGEFNYSTTDRQTRANSVKCGFINPDLNWAEDRVTVQDTDDITEFGLLSTDFIAVGCTNKSEAEARARYRLVTNLTETTMVSFTTNRQGQHLKQWDIILIADSSLDDNITGRITKQITHNKVELRDAVSLEANTSYEITFDYPENGETKTWTSPITNPAGATQELETLDPIPNNVYENAQFALSAVEDVTPKAYRVIGFTSSTDDDTKITVEAVEVNRAKWLYVDGASTETETSSSDTLQLSRAYPVQDLQYETAVENGAQNLELSWRRPAIGSFSTFEVKHFFEGSLINTFETNQTWTKFLALNVGVHKFLVATISPNRSMKSLPVEITYQPQGDIRKVPSVSDLKLTSGGEGSVFSSSKIILGWNEPDNSDILFDYYLVTLNNDHEYKTKTNSLAVDLAKISSPREIAIQVQTVDTDGFKSDPIGLFITNPQIPRIEDLDIVKTALGAEINLPTTNEPDYSRSYVHVLASPEELPTLSNRVWGGEGFSTSVNLTNQSNEVFIAAGHSDSYRTDDILWYVSPAISITNLLNFEEVVEGLRDIKNSEFEFNNINQQLEYHGIQAFAYDGFSIINCIGDLEFEANSEGPSNVKILGTYIDHPFNGKINVEETLVTTPWGSLFAPPRGRFYLVHSEENVSERFSGNIGSGHFFPAAYTGEEWKAFGNDPRNGEAFTPLPTDVLLAEAIKEAKPDDPELSLKDGITEIISFVRDTGAANARINTVESVIGEEGDSASPNGSIYSRIKHIDNTFASHQESYATNKNEVNTRFNQAETNISETTTALSDLSQSFGQHRLSINSRIDQAETNISETSITLSDLSQSFGQYQQTVSSQFSDVTSYVDNLIQTLSDADSALAQQISTTNTKVGNLESSTEQIAESFTGLNNSYSLFENTTTTRLNNVEGSVTQAQSSIGDMEGKLQLGYTVRLDNNGRISGFILWDNGETTQAAWTVGSFLIFNGNSNVPVFTAENGVVKMPNVEVDTIKANSITTDKLVDNSISKAAFVEQVSDLNLPTSTSFSERLSMVYPKYSNNSLIAASIVFETDRTGSDQYYYRVYAEILCDGVVVANYSWRPANGFPASVSQGEPIAGITAGSKTWKLRIKTTEGSNNNALPSGQPAKQLHAKLTLQEIKK